MNTPAHLLIGGALGGRQRPGLVGVAMLGSLLPDLSLYVLAGVSLFVLNIPPQVVFNELYFSDAWQTVFAVDNSVFVWLAVAIVAYWLRSDWLRALSIGALLHIALDFPLHHDDGRPHFWPLSDWVFESPFSYWDRAQGAAWIAPIEAALCLCAAAWLWRIKGWVRWVVIPLTLAEIWIVRQWLFIFDQ